MLNDLRKIAVDAVAALGTGKTVVVYDEHGSEVRRIGFTTEADAQTGLTLADCLNRYRDADLQYQYRITE
jgi:hypothetical protein